MVLGIAPSDRCGCPGNGIPHGDPHTRLVYIQLHKTLMCALWFTCEGVTKERPLRYWLRLAAPRENQPHPWRRLGALGGMIEGGMVAACRPVVSVGVRETRARYTAPAAEPGFLIAVSRVPARRTARTRGQASLPVNTVTPDCQPSFAPSGCSARSRSRELPSLSPQVPGYLSGTAAGRPADLNRGAQPGPQTRTNRLPARRGLRLARQSAGRLAGIR